MEIMSAQEGQIPLDDLSKNKFLALAVVTCRNIGWIIGDINQTGFISYTNNNLFSWNAEVRLKIINDTAIIQSNSTENQLIDVRENKKNIQNFISKFRELKKSMTDEEWLPVYEKIKLNFP